MIKEWEYYSIKDYFSKRLKLIFIPIMPIIDKLLGNKNSIKTRMFSTIQTTGKQWKWSLI